MRLMMFLLSNAFFVFNIVCVWKIPNLPLWYSISVTCVLGFMLFISLLSFLVAFIDTD